MEGIPTLSKIMYRSIHEQLLAAQLLLENALNEADIRMQIAEHGYHLSKLSQRSRPPAGLAELVKADLSHLNGPSGVCSEVWLRSARVNTGITGQNQ